jgi:Txe/YoeB family toxin of Txe-Axe toxin-antitoxin module
MNGGARAQVYAAAAQIAIHRRINNQHRLVWDF